MERVKIAVIGAGAAGMTASAKAAELGADVTLFEKNNRVGRKLGITGKGRCNLTNNCSVNEYIENVPRNPRFMYAAINGFSPSDTMDLFEKLGVPLKTERGNRVFPVSDKAQDIVTALKLFKDRSGVKTLFEKVIDIERSDDHFTVVTEKGRYQFERVIIATGGASYPLTGSTGDGYRFAEKLGINVTDIRPSLVPLETEEKWCRSLQGLSLKNVAVTVTDVKSGKCVYEDFGEMMFTHFGVTGPMVLSASAHLRDMEPGKYRMTIDLKPALDRETLDRRLLSDFAKYKNRDYSNALSDLLPSKLIDVFVELSGIPPHKKVNSITKEERMSAVGLLKELSFTIKGTRPIAEAIITSGGIDVKEINPKTMESKKIKGLYFAGEVIDVDAYTGGFNLQTAFSTAMLAADHAATDI